MTSLAYPDVIAAVTIWREARGESRDAKRGVAWVIFNRTQDKRWPGNAAAVCQQPKQFSCWNPDDPNYAKWPAFMDDVFESCCDAWDERGPDPTGGANHYHSFRDPADFPKWADPAKATVRIGAFTFYRL